MRNFAILIDRTTASAPGTLEQERYSPENTAQNDASSASLRRVGSRDAELRHAAAEAIARLTNLEVQYSTLLQHRMRPKWRLQLTRDREEIAAIRRALAAALDAGAKPGVLRKLVAAMVVALTVSSATVEAVANMDEAAAQVSELVGVATELIIDMQPHMYEPDAAETGFVSVEQAERTGRRIIDFSNVMFGSTHKLSLLTELARRPTGSQVAPIELAQAIGADNAATQRALNSFTQIGLIRREQRGEAAHFFVEPNPVWDLFTQMEQLVSERDT
jgi:hypothetical protein